MSYVHMAPASYPVRAHGPPGESRPYSLSVTVTTEYGLIMNPTPSMPVPTRVPLTGHNVVVQLESAAGDGSCIENVAVSEEVMVGYGIKCDSVFVGTGDFEIEPPDVEVRLDPFPQAVFLRGREEGARWPGRVVLCPVTGNPNIVAWWLGVQVRHGDDVCTDTYQIFTTATTGWTKYSPDREPQDLSAEELTRRHWRSRES